MKTSKYTPTPASLAAAGISVQLVGRADALIAFPFAEKHLIGLARGRPGATLDWDESAELFRLQLPGPWSDVRTVVYRVANRIRTRLAKQAKQARS